MSGGCFLPSFYQTRPERSARGPWSGGGHTHGWASAHCAFLSAGDIRPGESCAPIRRMAAWAQHRPLPNILADLAMARAERERADSSLAEVLAKLGWASSSGHRDRAPQERRMVCYR